MTASAFAVCDTMDPMNEQSILAGSVLTLPFL